MATLDMPYGRGAMPLHVPDARLRAVIAPQRPAAAAGTQEDIVRAALAQPIGSPPLHELARGKQRVLIITSDHTRPVPSRITMPLLLEQVRRGSPDADITILMATGMHRETTRGELIERFGAEIAEKEHIVIHQAQRDEDMAFFGTLPSGGELWLNRLAAQSELVIAEGFIEPHFFAGFSGGRKSILPGIASRKTVLYNHNAAFIASPNARAGRLEGNPIHRDMVYAARQAKLAFILNVLIDEDKRVIAAVAGDCERAHEAGCALCGKLNRAEPVISDIAVTSNGGYPLDQNLYQSVKGMTAAEACVRQDGVIIMCAALGDGHGGESFFRWFADRPDAQTVAADIESIPPTETRMDQWEAQILARVMLRASCIIVTGEENRALVEQMHLRWAPDADAALAMAEALVGADATVTVIPNGVGVIL